MSENFRKITLNGIWLFITDPEIKLDYEQIKEVYNNRDLPSMKIPSNWQVGGLDNYAGSVWFIKTFYLNDVKFNNSILEFLGVDYFADVWLNDNYLGNHEGYFQKFFFDVSNYLIEGENQLFVRVTSPKEDVEYTWPNRKKLIKGIFNHHDCRPGGWSKEYGQDKNTGGIWNDVNLILSNSIYISNIKVFPKIFSDENYALVNFEIDYLNSKKMNKTLKVLIKLSDQTLISREIELKPSNNQKLYLTFRIDCPKLWFPYDIGESNLYTLEIQADNETIFETSFGIREVNLIDNIFYINGEKYFLRGTNIIPEQNLSTLTEERIDFLVNSLKEANVNIVRVHAHVNRHELYEAFNKAGILVWQDFALQWTYDQSTEFISNAVRQIKDMVNQFHHHPSIVFWCCHNEPGEQIKTLDEFLFNAVVTEDNTRIVRKASNYEEHCYEGWYWGKKENYVATPMGPLVTEFGAQALPEKSSLEKFISNDLLEKPESEKWNYHNFQFEQTFHIAKIDRGNSIDEFIENSQSYQVDFLKEAIHQYRRKKYNGINGIFQFMFIDCWESITWSVIDYFGKKKKGFFTLRDAFNPILLSVNLRQNIYSNLSKKLNIEFWIINDYHKEFKNFKVLFSFDEKEIGLIEIDKILSDTIQKYDFEKIEIHLPEKIEPGLHRLKVELRDEKMDLISFDEFDLEFRNV
ncbi:MAG: glycoside hydrolase family 2 protein [Ignavibacteria bacterium]